MDHRTDAQRGEHAGRVERERIALAPSVVGDHDTTLGGVRDRPRLFRVEQPLAQAGRGLTDHETVHPHRPRSDGGAQPGGAELETAGEMLGEFVAVAALGTLDQVGELDGDVGIRLAGQPEVRGSERPEIEWVSHR